MRPLAFFRFLKAVLDIDTRLEEKTAKPGGPWKNRWWSSHKFTWYDGETYGPGEFLGKKLWPSKDLAETYVLENFAFIQEVLGVYDIHVRHIQAELA